MSSGSYFRTWKKFNNVFGNEADIAVVKAEYALRNAKDDWSDGKENNAKKHEEDLPLFLDVNFTAERGDLGSDDNAKKDLPRAFFKEDGKMCVQILEHFFGSGLPSLKKHYNLNSYARASSSVVVSASEAKQILQATKYLLCGHWSKDLDDAVMSANPFVEVLGDDYLKWKYRNEPSASKKRIYIDKEDENSWSLSFGDPQADAEEAEENERYEWTLKKLAAMLESFFFAEEDYSGSTEMVLEYCAF